MAIPDAADGPVLCLLPRVLLHVSICCLMVPVLYSKWKNEQNEPASSRREPAGIRRGGRGNKGAFDGNNNFRAPDVLLCKQTTLIAKSEDWRSSFRISTNHALRRPSLLVKVSQGPERPATYLGWPTPTSLCYFSKRAASKQGSNSNTQASAHQLSGSYPPRSHTRYGGT